MDERRLEHRLQLSHEHVVQDAVAKVGGKDLAGLCAVGHRTDRWTGTIRVLQQFPLQAEQRGRGIQLKAELFDRVAFIAAA